jgi:hypothetical protein
LLEIASANCNRKFQVQLAHKDFLQELKNIVGPKLQPPLEIQEKILFLIQVNFFLFSFIVLLRLKKFLFLSKL